MNYQNNPHTPPPYFSPEQYRPYPQYSPEPWYKPIRRNANIVCTGLFLVLLLGVFLMPAFTWLADCFVIAIGIESTGALYLIDMLCELLVTCLMLVIPVAIMRLLIGIPPAVAFPMRRPRASIAVPAVFICLCVSVFGALTYSAVVTIIQAVFGVMPYTPTFSAPTGIPAIILYYLRVALVPSILEELMFRGVIMQSLRRFGDVFALFCSAMLFGLAHRNIAQGLSALIVGLAIGFFVLRTGSLLTGMIIHLTNNTLSVITELVSKNMTANETGMFTAIQFALYIFSGLACFVFLLAFHGRIFSLAPSDYPVPEKKKYSVFFLAVVPAFYVITILVITLLNFR